MTEIMERATDLAEKNTPGVAFQGLGVLLENMFLGLFRLIGWSLGRFWFHGSRMLYFMGLAFADGYKSGVRAPVQVPQQPSVPAQPLVPAPPLMDDGRTHDAYSTPFGVPFGPNVQAWSEPG